jgi:hypothetical protein
MSQGVKSARLTALTQRVKANISEDSIAVVNELRRLLAEAEQGKIKGLTYVTHYGDDKGYDVGIEGWYKQYPTDAVGQLEILKLKLLRMALDGSP